MCPSARALRNGEAVCSRHLDIEKNHIRREAVYSSNGLKAVRDFAADDELRPQGVERQADLLPQERLVLGDDCRGGFHSPGSRIAGAPPAAARMSRRSSINRSSSRSAEGADVAYRFLILASDANSAPGSIAACAVASRDSIRCRSSST